MCITATSRKDQGCLLQRCVTRALDCTRRGAFSHLQRHRQVIGDGMENGLRLWGFDGISM